MILQENNNQREIGQRVFFLPACGSTQDQILRQRDQFSHGDVLWTADQTAGRGRYGRNWFSGSGSLAFSLLLESRETNPARLPLLLALGAVRFLTELGLDGMIKWPNDVYLEGKKILGILTESRQRDGCWEMVVGVGMNVANRADDFPSELRLIATSLSAHGQKLTPAAVLPGLLDAMDGVWRECRTRGWPELMQEIHQRLLWRDRKVTVVSGNLHFQGLLTGLGRDGCLLVSGRTVTAGEVVAVDGEPD